MSWSLTRPHVSLRVTQFKVARPIAGLKPEVRAAFKAKRERECRKVEPKIVLAN